MEEHLPGLGYYRVAAFMNEPSTTDGRGASVSEVIQRAARDPARSVCRRPADGPSG